MKLKIFFIILLIILTGSVQAVEEPDEIILEIEPETTKETPGETIKGSIFQSDYMTGNWFGLRDKPNEKGIDIQSSYIMTPIQSIPSGNARKDGSGRFSKMNYKGLFNLSLEIDSEKLNLYKGGKLFVLYQAANKGYSPNASLNSFMTVDSTDTGMNSLNQLSEYWYEQEFSDKFSLKIGKQDANADFQNIDGGYEYVNLSFSYIPTTPIPFYPTGQPGTRLKYET